MSAVSSSSSHSVRNYDVVIIGAGAAGLYCAAQAGKLGKSVVVLDHANKVGKKILMSGGGRCNFTNMYAAPGNYLSANKHFCKSALSQHTPWDFIALVNQYQVPYHEKKHGQLFCDNKAQAILNVLLDECAHAGASILSNCHIEGVSAIANGEQRYRIATSLGVFTARSLVVATGGLSIPTLGATGLGYELAEQFALALKPRRAGLVPFTLSKEQLAPFAGCAGASLEVSIECNGQVFNDSLLFTHRGLSGPAVLQISSYWQPGQRVNINLLPGIALEPWLKEQQRARPKVLLHTLIAEYMPKSLAQVFCQMFAEPGVLESPLADYSHKALEAIAEQFHGWVLMPAGTEGYRTAEVTLGGVDTDYLSSKTMECKHQPGLFFIGEVVDVTGQLGGFNFQWAWASAYVAAQHA